MDHIVWSRRPQLVEPTMIAAFAGWNDAGDAATVAAQYLSRRFESEVFAGIDPEWFYDFSIQRPVLRLGPDGRRSLQWPANEFSHLRLDDGRDVIILTGIEPRLRWRTFTEAILEVIRSLGVVRVVTLGALLSEVHHLDPVPVIGSAAGSDMLSELDLQPSRYQGPTGIVGVLQMALARVGVPAASLWASVPNYVASSPSPKAALALVSRLAELLDLSLAATDLQIAAVEYERQVEALVEEDPELAEFAAELRALGSAVPDSDHPAGAGELLDSDPGELIAELERYLEQNGDT